MRAAIARPFVLRAGVAVAVGATGVVVAGTGCAVVCGGFNLLPQLLQKELPSGFCVPQLVQYISNSFTKIAYATLVYSELGVNGIAVWSFLGLKSSL
jgi:hypothetical protein